MSLALRPQVIIVGPLLPEMRADLGMSFAAAGLFGTIPVLCMGIFAPLGPIVARRIRPRWTVAWCVAVIATFGLLRALAPEAVTALALTFGIGVGMGVVGPVLPMIVRARAAGHPTLATGGYATGIVLGGTIAAALALPLAGDEGWRRALTIISFAAIGSLVAWLVLLPPAPSDAATVRTAQPDGARHAHTPVWRRRGAWLLGLVFGFQSILYYGTQTWLANVYIERGLSVPDAAGLVVLFNGVSLVATVLVPVLADRFGSRRQQLSIAAGASLVGTIGLAAGLLPAALWVIVLGIGSGSIFPIVLTLPVDAADRPRDVASIAAFMLLVGYAMASLSPFVLGLFRDLSGGFVVSVWVLVAVAGALLLSIPRRPLRHA